MKTMKLRDTLRGFLRLVHMAYRKYLFLLILQCGLLVMQSLFSASVLSVFLTFLAAESKGDIWQIALALAGIYGVLSLAAKAVTGQMKVQQVELKEKIQHMIFMKNTRIPYEQFERPEFLALTETAYFAASNENCIELALTNGTKAIQAVLTLGSIAVITLAFDWRLTVILCVAAGMNFGLMKWFSGIRTAYWRKQVTVDRGYVYFSDELYRAANGKDFRMYTIGRLLQKKFHSFAKELVDGIREMDGKEAAVSTVLQGIGSIETILIYAIVIEHTRKSFLSAASITFFVSIALQFMTAMALFISASMRLLTGLERTEPLTRLMEQPEEDGQEGYPFQEAGFSIQVRNVSFVYPGTSEPALDHVSFDIKNGEVVSLVGLNGAGKTTFIKLLCRFYHPTDGDILVNGRSIYDYSMTEYLRLIGSVFQDFRLFPVSIKNNVSFEAGVTRVESVLRLLGLSQAIDRWPDGIESCYDKGFSEKGVELSGGEAQKVALARALIRDSRLLLLDEPTSALDPLAEADFYESLRENVKGKTCIFVSHRMSSSVFSDKIIVFSNGRVEDQGKHGELMQKEKGLYHELFTRQAKGY